MPENNLPILSFAQDAPPDQIGIDLSKFLESRGLIQADSGGGKSHLLRGFLEATAPRVQQIIFDLEGEFASLRSIFPYVLVGPEGDLPARLDTAAILCRRALEFRFSCIIDLSELDLKQRQEYVKSFVDEALAVERRLWHHCLFVVDELPTLAPENGSGSSVATISLERLATLGRKRGWCFVGGAQRIADVSKTIVAQLSNKFIGLTTLDTDARRAATMLKTVPASDLARLQRGEFYVYGPAITSTATKVRTGANRTQAPELGSEWQAPPAPEELREVLAALGDLPAQAENENQTVEQLQRTIARLERNPGKEVVRTVEKIVEKRVEVPVVKEAPDFREKIKRAEQFAAACLALEKDCQNLGLSIGSIGREILTEIKTLNGEGAQKSAHKEASAPFLPPAPPNSKAPKSNLPADVQRIINALAEFDQAGVNIVSRPNLKVWMGIKPTTESGAWKKAQGLALVGYPSVNNVQLTEQGLRHAQALGAVTRDAFTARWANLLEPPQVLIYKTLIKANPEGLTPEDLARQTATNPNSAKFKADIKKLCEWDIVAQVDHKVKAVFPEGLN